MASPSSSPQRRIASEKDLDPWRVSPAYTHLMNFIQATSTAVKGKLLSDPIERTPAIEGLVKLLEAVDEMTTQIPPVQQPSRFGNAAFRTWYDRLAESAPALVEAALPGQGLQGELVPYLLDSFGNRTRIDYGSGHELAFVAVLCCLHVRKILSDQDLPAACLVVFYKYLQVVRRIQRTYRLEPAGSHGSWGLDDFQFLPYYWGASQLIGSRIPPAQLGDKSTADRYADDYMFFGCVRFIFEMKTGPFHEHSRTLYDISAVQEWGKVNSGLLKMYVAEVLLKLPIVQHFLFGPTLSFDAAPGTVAVLLPERPLPVGMPVAGAVAPNTMLSRISGTGGPASGSLRRPGAPIGGAKAGAGAGTGVGAGIGAGAGSPAGSPAGEGAASGANAGATTSMTLSPGAAAGLGGGVGEGSGGVQRSS